MTAVVLGAGAWGRGLVAPLLSETEVVLVDRDADLVAALAAAGEYGVVVDDVRTEVSVDALDLGADAGRVAAEIAAADLVVTAAGTPAYPALASVVAAGLEQRLDTGQDAIDGGLRLVVLTAEDDPGAADLLAALVGAALPESLADQLHAVAVFAPTAVDRVVVVRAGELDVVAGATATWSVGRAVPMPRLTAPAPVADLPGTLARTALTIGIARPAAAWLAAAGDPAPRVRALLAACARVLEADHGFGAEALARDADAVLARVADPALHDLRAGAHRLHRLRREWWLLHAALRLAELGEDPAPALAVVAAALAVPLDDDDPDAEELRRTLAESPPAVALAQVTGVPSTHPLHPALLEVFTR